LSSNGRHGTILPADWVGMHDEDSDFAYSNGCRLKSSDGLTYFDWESDKPNTIRLPNYIVAKPSKKSKKGKGGRW
jgi:hypothetical protein